MGMNAVIIEAKNGIRAIVEPSDNVYVKSVTAIDAELEAGVMGIAKMLAESDPTDPELKKCSRCAKLGRVPYHPVEQFSRLKNGKLLSQCKVCRVEQTVKWDTQQGDRRKEYQREYQKRRKPAVRRAKEAGYVSVRGCINASDALFTVISPADPVNMILAVEEETS